MKNHPILPAHICALGFVLICEEMVGHCEIKDKDRVFLSPKIEMATNKREQVNRDAVFCMAKSGSLERFQVGRSHNIAVESRCFEKLKRMYPGKEDKEVS